MAEQLAVSSQSVADAGTRSREVKRLASAGKGHKAKDSITSVPIRPHFEVDKIGVEEKRKKERRGNQERNGKMRRKEKIKKGIGKMRRKEKN